MVLFVRAEWLSRKWIASNFQLRAADETKSRVKSLFPTIFWFVEKKDPIFGISEKYNKTTIYLSFGEMMDI